MDDSSFHRFIGLAGNYLSLQYLSVSDATVLQFLTPMCVGVAGALLLKEHLARGQIVASRGCIDVLQGECMS